MPLRRIKPIDGIDAVRLVLADSSKRVVSDPDFKTAVRYLLEELSFLRPGRSVEVRVPPLGAVQCVDGLTHRRGTPPNTVELGPLEWFALAVGEASWDSLVSSGKILASGTRADISDALPIWR
ncbi:MAG: hypothetical protein RLZZ380_369 [Actinomycetota bacterium]|jgi:hypothetical protein